MVSLVSIVSCDKIIKRITDLPLNTIQLSVETYL